MKRITLRFWLYRAWVAVVFWSIGFNLSAQTNTHVFVAPPPDWVRPVEWSAPAPHPPKGKSEGTRYLLDERQAYPLRQEEYIRMVTLMENETGVQDSGSLTFYFDPSYQELILHQVQIHRAGQILNRLDQAKIKIIQPEPSLDGHMITGEHSALVFVEDLRVGDVLEYACTTRGYNPVLGGHYAAKVGVQFSTPVDCQQFRLLWPSEKPLRIGAHLTDVLPAKQTGRAITEYVWNFTNTPAIDYEDCLPASFEAYAYVEASDFKDWAGVVDWALPLYAHDHTNFPPELARLLQEWKNRSATVEEQAGFALEFVQDQLRYTALELGPDSYRPTPPFETFQKRFGDCKGKTLLLCTLLRALGLEAWPALVNSSVHEAIADRLPSPFVFNHVIVKLILAGQPVWLDPTFSHQGGELTNRFLSQLGKALVIKPGSTALEDVPRALANNTRQQVLATFDMPDYKSSATFTVVTTYRGYGADDLREQLARNDQKELAKEYLNYYARRYPGIEATDPLEVSDDRKSNVLIVTEHYSIKNLWKLNAASKKLEAEFEGESLVNLLTDPKTRLRTRPLRIPFPLRREHELVIHLPDSNWNLPTKDKIIDHEAFSFHYHRTYTGKVLRYQLDCETKVPELPASKVADYLIRLDEMESAVGERLECPNADNQAAAAGLNWLMVVIALFGTLFTIAVIVWAWRSTKATIPAAPLSFEEQQLQGLGGWLILVGFGLCVGPVTRLFVLKNNWEGYFSLQVWQSVAMPQGTQYHPLYAPLLIAEMLGNIGLLGLSLLVAGLFFEKRRAFPKTFILLFWSNAFFVAADELCCRQIPALTSSTHGDSLQAISRVVWLAIFWSAYMVRSRRVKATFIR